MKINQKLKVIVSSLIILSCLLAFCGCGAKTDSGKEKTEEVTINPVDVVGVSPLQYPSKNNEFRFNVYEDYIQITEYLGKESKITIPSKINNLPVLSIRNTTFSVNNYNDNTNFDYGLTIYDTPLYNIEEIIIEEGVYEIEESTFANLPSLEKVVLPDSLTLLGNAAFKNCVSLKELTIPANVNYISDELCYGCESLTNVTIKETKDATVETATRTIAYYAFANCPSLRYIWLPADISTIQDSAFMNFHNDLVFAGYTAGSSATYAANNLIDFEVLDKTAYDKIIQKIKKSIPVAEVAKELDKVDISTVFKNFENPEKHFLYNPEDKTLYIAILGENDFSSRTTFENIEGVLTYTNKNDKPSLTTIKADNFWVKNIIKIVAEKYGYNTSSIDTWLEKREFSKLSIEKDGIAIQTKTCQIGEQEAVFYSSVEIDLINGIPYFEKEFGTVKNPKKQSINSIIDEICTYFNFDIEECNTKGGHDWQFLTFNEEYPAQTEAGVEAHEFEFYCKNCKQTNKVPFFINPCTSEAHNWLPSETYSAPAYEKDETSNKTVQIGTYEIQKMFCSECNKVRFVSLYEDTFKEIEKTTTDTNINADTNSENAEANTGETTTEQNTETEKDNKSIIIIAVLGVVIFAALGYLVITKIKKR